MLISLYERMTEIAQSNQAQEVIEQAASKIPYIASGSTVIWGLNADEWGIFGVIVGIALGVATFGFNIWFKMHYRKNRRRGAKNGHN